MKKNYILFILLISFNTLSFSQDYKKEIKKGFNTYLNTLTEGNFEESVEYMPPELFEIISKEYMVKTLESLMNSSDIVIKFDQPEIIDISNKELIEEKYYSTLTYDMLLLMKFIGDDNEKETEKLSRLSIIRASLKDKFGDNKVSFNSETEFFQIESRKNGIAISNNGLNNWKYLEIDKSQQIFLERLVPKELSDRFFE